MNQNSPYNQFNLTKEMLATKEVVNNFDIAKAKKLAQEVKAHRQFMLTGEGSSRIFPAKRSVSENLQKKKSSLIIQTEGATQALEYALGDWAVFGASNSGKTKEVVRLFNTLKSQNKTNFFGLTATANTPIADMPSSSYVLDCGKEEAVAATKSVVEQALFYQVLFNEINGDPAPDLKSLADFIDQVLTQTIDPEIIKALSKASIIHFAGRNNGVAEELALKTNEITRKKSTYLEGTYAVHGIEEVMHNDEVVVIVDPFEAEEEKFKECLAQGVGMNVIAISTRKTLFPTVVIPDLKGYSEYLQLCAGWSLLVEIGIKTGIDLDRPIRARKVGNEFIE